MPEMPEIMDGTWLPVAAELSGQQLPEGSLSKLELAMAGANYELKVGGVTVDRGVIELFPEAAPKAMRIIGSEGPNKGGIIPAIYQLGADAMTICYDLSGERTPADFKTEAGSQLYLVTYHRGSN